MSPSVSALRSAAAIAGLDHFPPIVREALAADPKFLDEYGLGTNAIMSIGASGVSFQRSDIIDAVKSVLDSAAEATVSDTEGGVWRVEVRRTDNETTVGLHQGNRSLVGVQFVWLSSDSQTRLKTFRAEARRVNFPAKVAESWEALLSARAPEADELMDLIADLADTPTGKRLASEEAFRHGSVPFDHFAPRSERYFERLVGKHEDGQSLSDYIVQAAAPHMQALIEHEPFQGYLLALLVSASQSLGTALSKLQIADADLSRVYDWLIEHGDMLSRASAVEAGLLRAQRSELVREALGRLIHTIITPPPVETVDPYRLVSVLFMLVYGEMSYTRTLASKPPYWRRLAALAHAALIARAMMSVAKDIPRFVKWGREARGQIFFLQCYCDMRIEPRWIPDFAMPHQIKHELAGRVFHAANGREESVVADGWKGLLLDDVEGGLRRQLDIRQAFVPGPLEGSLAPVLEIPEESLLEMRASLQEPVITISSFSALANSAILFRIPTELCDLAAEAIARADYHFAEVDDTKPLIPHLLSLATAAAITRNERLADALFIVVRKYRRLYPEALTIENAFRTIMHASASREDLNEWCKCVGSALTELSFQDIAEDDAISLHSHIVHLCDIVPELWATCGQAEAALRSVLNT
jgi:hypothetical protein